MLRARPVLFGATLSLVLGCAQQPPDEPVGKASEPIIGGIDDTWRTYVVGVGSAQMGGAVCTGTVISSHSILTAGHCWGSGRESLKTAYFGADLNGNPQTIAIATSVRHPQWNGRTLANDLTMVQLADAAPTQPAPILRETMDGSDTWIGPNFSFVGFGVDNGRTQRGFGIRRVATFPIDVMGPGPTAAGGPIGATQFHYETPGENTCNGDSGGPALVARSGVERLAGTTSYGDGSCVKYGVDARADQPALDDWIQSMIDQFEGATNDCRSDGVCDETCNGATDLVDPDCAPNHCGADGMCVLSCVLPVDPDCKALGIDFCGADGACDPACPSFDPDCAPLCGADGICVPTCPSLDPDCADHCGADGVCVTACASPDPDCPPPTTSASTGSTGGGGAGTSSSTTASSSAGGAGGSVATSAGGGGAGGAGGHASSASSAGGATISASSTHSSSHSSSSSASAEASTSSSSSASSAGGGGGAGEGGGATVHVTTTSGCACCEAGEPRGPLPFSLIALFGLAPLLRRRRTNNRRHQE